jgi:magnesium-transporting ATPase (P-type)
LVSSTLPSAILCSILCASSLHSSISLPPYSLPPFSQVFASYGLTFTDLAHTGNNYFTSYPLGPYTNSNGQTFSVSEQNHILSIGQGTWFLMIVIGQAVHIWACRTLTSSIFCHGFFTNYWTGIGVGFALSVGVLIVYCPGIQTVVMAYNPPSLIILYGALVSVACIIPLTEGRKWLLRNCSSQWTQYINI